MNIFHFYYMNIFVILINIVKFELISYKKTHHDYILNYKRFYVRYSVELSSIYISIYSTKRAEYCL